MRRRRGGGPQRSVAIERPDGVILSGLSALGRDERNPVRRLLDGLHIHVDNIEFCLAEFRVDRVQCARDVEDREGRVDPGHQDVRRCAALRKFLFQIRQGLRSGFAGLPPVRASRDTSRARYSSEERGAGSMPRKPVWPRPRSSRLDIAARRCGDQQDRQKENIGAAPGIAGGIVSGISAFGTQASAAVAAQIGTASHNARRSEGAKRQPSRCSERCDAERIDRAFGVAKRLVQDREGVKVRLIGSRARRER